MVKKKAVLFKLVVALFAAGSFSSIFATSTLPNCTTASLASYVSSTQNPPASGGCAIGILDYYNMTYYAGSNAPSASSITVTPNSNPGFSFGPVTAAPGQTVQFEIDYDIFIDPAPIITGDSLGLDIMGDVSVTEYFCNDLPLNFGTGLSGAATCLGSVPASATLHVDNNTPADNFNSVTFATPVTKFQEVAIVFTLHGGANGAQFDGLDASSTVVGAPEPASIGLALAGLLAAAGSYKLRKRHNR